MRSLLFVAALLACAWITPMQAASITNGSFETGDLTGWTCSVCSELGGWFAEDIGFAYSGSWNADTDCSGAGCLNPSTGVTLSQVPSGLVSGGTYDLSFAFYMWPTGRCNATCELDVYWGGTEIGQYVNYTGWQVEDLSITEGSGNGSDLLLFAGRDDPGNIELDDVTLTGGPAIGAPEPAPFALVGSSLVVCFFVHLRRSRRKAIDGGA
jgi:hypothetical protein